MGDKEIEKLIKLEELRQKKAVNLIASENYVSEDVLRALGSVFTNKYAEGYSGARYYGGNEVVDKLENLCKQRALKLYNLNPDEWHVNVQSYSGSPANLAIYSALIPTGKKIMSMRLDMGGHLTHIQRVSFTGKIWQQVAYGVDPKTEVLDYKAIQELAEQERPYMIICGFTAYSRIIDFKKFREIADKSKSYLMVDMSHIAGLVAGGVHPSPFPYAHVVMATTHKTLRGPRGAIIFSRKQKVIPREIFLENSKPEYIHELIDKAVFPGLQGGPHMHQVAAIAVCLKEAASLGFKKYSKQIVKNSRVLAGELEKRGWRIVSGGTDNHLFLVDTWKKNISGKIASEKLEKAGIIVNKNQIPFDTRSPFDPSGIRIGTAAITALGMKEKDMKKLAERIDKILLS